MSMHEQETNEAASRHGETAKEKQKPTEVALEGEKKEMLSNETKIVAKQSINLNPTQFVGKQMLVDRARQRTESVSSASATEIAADTKSNDTANNVQREENANTDENEDTFMGIYWQVIEQGKTELKREMIKDSVDGKWLIEVLPGKRTRKLV